MTPLATLIDRYPGQFPYRSQFSQFFAHNAYQCEDNNKWTHVYVAGKVTREHDHCLPIIEQELVDSEVHKRLTDNLLTEAIACRTCTVPTDAFVECAIQPFVGVHVVEQANAIFFAWEDRKGRIASFSLNVGSRDTDAAFGLPSALVSGSVDAWVDADYHGYYPNDPIGLSTDEYNWIHNLVALALGGVRPSHLSALQFLSAAILRDFWVVEDKDSVGLGSGPRYCRVHGHISPQKRIIYLPRVRYRRVLVSSAGPCGSETTKWAVSKHWVRSHFRALPARHKATPRQIAIATLHGVTVDDGETWVRGHTVEGRDGFVERAYRSRSATRTLLEVSDPLRSDEALQELSWFSFERLCERLLQEGGLEIVSKVGDGGIDIVAVDDSGGHVLVQAKHWAKRVGPGAVQTTAGARDGRYAGVKAKRTIMMSSSGFSEGATREARALGIELITVNAVN